MTKGKPWPADDEKKLKDWYTMGTTDFRVLAFSFDGRYTEEAIRQKLIKFGLLKEQQQQKNSNCCCSTQLELPEELPSIEETLKMLAAALEALKTPGLDKAEVLRLRGIIAGAKVYQERFAEYVHYRELEEELMEARKKIAELIKKSQSNAQK
ncbi:MAG: hypothetical protein NWF01_07080 [Candidatus Bathyarchaeota archaeon]|nr:hypothetical protein [Candidatus Bathyarchaeota archaeon]